MEFINPIGLKLDLATAPPTTNDQYRLLYLDLDLSVNSDKQGGPTDDHDLFVSSMYPGGAPLSRAGTPVPSNFYRMISVQHATAQELTVTSDVQWMSQNVKHEISLQSVLGDYQKVKTAT